MAKENINLDFRLKIYERKKFFCEEKKKRFSERNA